MMKKLLIAFLLAVFALQGAFVAVGADTAAVVDKAVAAAKLDAADILGTLDGFAQAGDAGESDELDGSAAVEELSDYLPALTSLSRAVYPMPARRPPGEIFLSIHLPTIKPPPRA